MANRPSKMLVQIKRKDKNHNQIQNACKEMGFTVKDMSQLGGGFPDLIVAKEGYTVIGLDKELENFLKKHKISYFRGGNLLIEIKSAKGKLSEGQKEFFKDWKGAKMVARCISDIWNKIKKN